MTLASIETDVVTRLALCGLEISGVGRTWQTPPAEPVGDADLPAGYTLIGPRVEGQDPSPGYIVVNRQYVWRLLIMPILTGLDDSHVGAESNQRALPFFTRIAEYFAEHPQLNTASLGTLRGVRRHVEVLDSGLAVRKGPGGVNYATIDTTLTIEVVRNLSQGTVPYNS